MFVAVGLVGDIECVGTGKGKLAPCIRIRRWRLSDRILGKRKGLFNKFHMSGDISLTKGKIKAVRCTLCG